MDTTYHKIETLYERDENHRLKPELMVWWGDPARPSSIRRDIA